MKDYALLSSAYRKATLESILKRRAALCELLEDENCRLEWGLANKMQEKLRKERNITVCSATIFKDLECILSARDYIRGDSALSSYAVNCLIRDGVKPLSRGTEFAAVLEKGELFIEEIKLLFDKLSRVSDGDGEGGNITQKAFAQMINQQGHLIISLEKKCIELEKQLTETSDKVSSLEKAEHSQKEEIAFLKGQIKSLEEDLDFKDLELVEALSQPPGDFHDDLVLGSAADSDESISFTCPEDDKNAGKEYVFPKFSKAMNLPIVLGDGFMDSFCRLPKESRKLAIKSMEKLAENGPAYPSLSAKKMYNGEWEGKVNYKHRIFWVIEDQKIIFLRVVHKNSL